MHLTYIDLCVLPVLFIFVNAIKLTGHYTKLLQVKLTTWNVRAFSCSKLFVENGSIDFNAFCRVMTRYQQNAAAADAQHAFKVCKPTHNDMHTCKQHFSGILRSLKMKILPAEKFEDASILL